MKGLDIPERFTGTIYAVVYNDPSSCLYGFMSFSEHEPSDDEDKIAVGSVEVDIPLDVSGSLDKQIVQLRKSKQRIIDDATEKAGQIDEAIESLLAIEHKNSEVES